MTMKTVQFVVVGQIYYLPVSFEVDNADNLFWRNRRVNKVIINAPTDQVLFTFKKTLMNDNPSWRFDGNDVVEFNFRKFFREDCQFCAIWNQG